MADLTFISLDEVDEEKALDAYSQAVVAIAESLSPSVANLRVTRRVRGGRRAVGGGSGVVITPDGYMLTSAHVVAATDGKVEASFVDGREVAAEVVGADPPRPRRAALGGGRAQRPCSATPRAARRAARRRDREPARVRRVRDRRRRLRARALAARALARRRPDRGERHPDGRCAQPGQLGGALADGRGCVVGINTAVAASGSAWPCRSTTSRAGSSARSCARAASTRAYIGIAGGSHRRPGSRASWPTAGVEVVEVVEGSPAAKAGLRPEDLIVSVAGTPVEGADDLAAADVGELIGERVEATVVREGRTVTIDLVPVELAV